jgi:tetratricopeptide (TPR) repeat protein
MQRKDYEAAQKAALKATTIDPQNPIAWFNVAYSSEMLGDLPKAESAYKTVIAINPRHPSAFNNLGLVYRKMGRDEEAIANYRKQLEVAPRSRYATYNLARALALQGDWEEALPLASLAAEVNADDVNRLYFLGKAQIKTTHIEEARKSFDRVLALPHQPMMENNVAYELADAGIDLDKSWKLISGALPSTERLACEPQSLTDGDECTAQLRQLVFMLDTAGWALYRQGKTKEAEPYLRSSFAITPRGDNELHLVVVLAKSGRLAEAVDLFKLARARPTFDRLESREALRELVKAAGGEAELDTLLGRATLPPSPSRIQGKVIALVDGSGKVIEAQAVEPAPASLVDAAKTMTLPALSWPGYSLRSVRSIEFQRNGDQWSPSAFYVGLTPPPPPCARQTPLPPVITTSLRPDATPAAQLVTCPAAY